MKLRLMWEYWILQRETPLRKMGNQGFGGNLLIFKHFFCLFAFI